jgi:heptosyltransferase-1
MRRVLIVKTSSMGDVIHTLPALTDAKVACPDVEFDWVVEEGFQEIPKWHPAVSDVIPVAIRRWRKSIFKTMGSTEWRQFRNLVKKHHYDLVIDAQGLLKSAWLCRLIKAPTAGYDRHSVRERLASWVYQHRYAVPVDMHAVERIRTLFAKALGYQKPEAKGQYGLPRSRFCTEATDDRSVVFLHGTTRADKHYPEIYWKQLAERLREMGFQVRMPWGNEQERARAERIAQGLDNVEVLPKLNLAGVAGVLAQATAVVAVDTGLGHLSAALNIPTISLYGPTNPGLIGAYGENQIHLCSGDMDAVDVVTDPEVFAPLTPERLLQHLTPMLGL